ncbi:hypothetical protein V5O48_010232 [Marasmius crinis-equi]|uniref:Glycoside hydrolase family 76 protein n=1 Tax=Marasmius crinis-equi TaxID=585013 RepID=A0ABR3F989_9AGAR
MFFFFILFHFLATAISVSDAQTFAPNPAWKTTNISIPIDERIAIAKDGIDKTLSMIVDANGQLKFEDVNYGAIGRFLSQMAQFDMLTNQTIYKKQLLDFFPQAEKFRPGFIHLSTYVDFGSSSKDFYFNHLRNPRGVMLDGLDAVTCSPSNEAYPANMGLMIEGLAVLHSVSNQDTDATLSYLNEIVNNTVSNRGWYNTDGILAADDCEWSLYCRAYASSHLATIVNRTTSIAELVDQYIVRGLVAILHRNTTQSPLRTYIQEYLGVQASAYPSGIELSPLIDICSVKYNAVLSNARGKGKENNIYGAPWTGAQQPMNFSLEYQTNALSLLIPAISIQNDTTTPERPKPQPTTSAAKTRANLGAIVGGVVGGLAVMALLTIFVLWLIRRRSRTMQISDTNAARSEDRVRNRIEPFTNPASEKIGHRGGKQLSTTPRDLERAQDMSLTDLDRTNTDISSSRSPLGPNGEISTADLVMLLNHRLQGQGREWREDEQPPDYASQGTPSDPRRPLEK